ncbi:MAG: hypothetical protein IH940_03500 [Acidobacteria bacterium]|nr:hypothetical protein [Acidobacteriota bacterium]
MSYAIHPFVAPDEEQIIRPENHGLSSFRSARFVWAAHIVSLYPAYWCPMNQALDDVSPHLDLEAIEVNIFRGDHAMWFHRPLRAARWLLRDQWTRPNL